MSRALLSSPGKDMNKGKTIWLAWLAWLVPPVFIFLVLQYRIFFDDTGLNASHVLEEKIHRLSQDNDIQQQKNQSLMMEVKDLKTGTSLLEETAREDLGLIKEGETFILFVEPEKNK